MSDLESMSDDTWHTLLQHILIEYVTLLTNLEGPAQSAPTLTRKEIIERDTARNEARAAAIAAAAAAAADSGDSGGDGGGDRDGGVDGDDAASGHGDEDEATQPRRARRCRRGERISEPFVGRLIPWHNCHGGTWNRTRLITHTRVHIE
jgi:hypothetical protein